MIADLSGESCLVEIDSRGRCSLGRVGADGLYAVDVDCTGVITMTPVVAIVASALVREWPS